MGGSVYFAVFVAIIMFVLAIAFSTLFIIPAVIVLLVGLFSAPIMAAIARGGGGGGAKTGTPSTSDASYEPVSQPEDRGV